MTRSDPYLKAYIESKGDSGLRAEIASVWQSIRDRNLYSGGPRSSQTDQAIARALAALKVASQTNDRGLLAEACRLMAHSLNADGQYEPSLDYYLKAIALFESSGSGEQAARTRLGNMAALYMMGKYDEAIEVAGVAERWFLTNNHVSEALYKYWKPQLPTRATPDRTSIPFEGAGPFRTVTGLARPRHVLFESCQWVCVYRAVGPSGENVQLVARNRCAIQNDGTRDACPLQQELFTVPTGA